MELSEKQVTINKVFDTVGLGLAGGCLAQAVHYHLLSPETKMAFNNSRHTLDSFVSEAGKCAEETMRNTNLKIDLAKVKENAAKMYETISKKAPEAVKAVKRTGLIAGAGIMAAAALFNFVIAPKIKADKSNKQG